MSDNWVVQNLQNALDTWNKYLSEIWQLITQSPEQFKGGTIWGVIVNIHDAVRAIGLALLVLFFVVGVMRTCGSFAEVKKPEHALKLFIRFALCARPGMLRKIIFIQSAQTHPACQWLSPWEQRRRPPPVAETGRNCWGSGQQDASESEADAGSRNPTLARSA